jgi:hypothetical protein
MDSDSARKKKGLACPRCGNRLRVRPDQLGSQVICPKCEATFTVARPGSLASSSTANADDEYEPEIPLTRTSAVPEEQMTDLSPAANRQTGYEVDWASSDELEVERPHQRPTEAVADHLAQAEARGMLRTERLPDPPRWTFFSGVFGFPWQGPNIFRWVAMSFGMLVSGFAGVMLVGVLRGGVGLGTLAGPLLSMITGLLVLMTASFAAPCFLAAVEDTADGFDEVQESTLPGWDQWYFSMFSVLSVLLLSGAITFPLTFVEAIGPAAVPVGGLIFFPILVLSALECESFVMPLSPPILTSLVRVWRAWLMFYLVTTPLVVGWLAVAIVSLPAAPFLAVVPLAPALAAVLLIYARLLGRLGWTITGSPAMSREDHRAGDSGRPKAAKKKRRRKQRAFPGDLDAAADMVADRRPTPGPSAPDRRD